VRPGDGHFPWPRTLSVEVWGELSSRGQTHLSQFGEKLERDLAISLEEASPEEEPLLDVFLYPLVPPGYRDKDFPADAGPSRQDAYLLAVEGTITLWAGGEPGMFYALETLLQLFRNGGTSGIPGLVIRDAPAFAHRMVQYDIAREQTVCLDYLKQVIRRLASLKVNQVMLYIEYRYRWKSHPAFGPPDTLTAELARELTDYARSYCVDLIPQVNVLGHVEGFLRHADYAHLREVPEEPFQLCPTDPKSFELFKQLTEEMLPHFHSPFFHVGGDESFLLGRCPRCQEKAEKEGIGALYADHMIKFHELLASHGKRMMIWGDIILQHRDIAGRLPKDIVIFDWHYHSSSPETLDFFRDQGFEVYAASSLGGYESNRLIWRWDRLDANTGPFFRDAADRSLFGACFTTWEMFHGNVFQNNWYPVIYGASAAWNPSESSEGGLADRFGEAFMADPENALVEILRILAGRLLRIWKGFAGESAAKHIRATLFHADPLLLPRLISDELDDEQSEQIQNALDEATRLLESARARKLRNADLLDFIHLVVQMYRSVLVRLRAFRTALAHYSEGLDKAERGNSARVRALAGVIEALLPIKNDLSRYLTILPSAVQRYGSSIHDLERCQKQCEELDRVLAVVLGVLESYPEKGLPEMQQVGLE
jgi:signal transduction histidine kinase